MATRLRVAVSIMLLGDCAVLKLPRAMSAMAESRLLMCFLNSVFLLICLFAE